MLRLCLALVLAVPCFAEPVALHLSARAEKHVREGHFAGGKNSRGKSLFSAGTDLLELLKAAEASKPRRERNGRDKRVTPTKEAVGTDGRSGKAVRSYVVISDPDGEVVTMYPGR